MIGHLPLDFVKRFLVHKDVDLAGLKTCIDFPFRRYACVVVFPKPKPRSQGETK